jgi:colicin import membrane protein
VKSLGQTLGEYRREPDKLAALLLALAVHIAFFAFLYFGISWQRKPQEPLVAELWSELPPPKPTPRVEPPRPEPPPPEPKVVEPPKPPPPPAPKVEEPKPPTKADIELKERRRKAREEKLAEENRRREELKRRAEEQRQEAIEERQRKEQARKEEEQRKKDEAARLEQQRKEEEAKRKEQERLEAQARREQEERLEREAEVRRAAILEEQQKRAAEAKQRAEEDARKRREAELEAAKLRELNSWRDRIQAKIHSKVVVPPGVSPNAQAEYEITIIPGGEVLNVRMVKGSGFPAYDAAIERAINAAAPLPVPSDPALFQQLRQPRLKFRPE